MEIHASPAQESYEIGSQVTLNCTVTPSPLNSEDFIFPATYRWYSADRWSYFSRSIQITIAPSEQDSIEYYCLIFLGGRLLGKGGITLNIKGRAQSSYIAASCNVHASCLYNII